jgi:hypothetical protein
MKRNVIIAMIAVLIILLLFLVGIKAYFGMKSDSAVEAANVFVSPSHINLFNEHFTPYPKDQAQKCYALNNKLKKSRNLRLIDSDWGGVYVFQADSDSGTSLFFALSEDVHGKWGVECWEK